MPQLGLIQKMLPPPALAEEQPVAPPGPAGFALFQKSAERRDPGAGADHNQRRGIVIRQAEMLVFMRENLQLAAGCESGQVAGAQAVAECSPGVFMPAHPDQQMRLAFPRRRGGGQRIQARRQPTQGFQRAFQIAGSRDSAEQVCSRAPVGEGRRLLSPNEFGHALSFGPAHDYGGGQ